MEGCPYVPRTKEGYLLAVALHELYEVAHRRRQPLSPPGHVRQFCVPGLREGYCCLCMGGLIENKWPDITLEDLYCEEDLAELQESAMSQVIDAKHRRQLEGLLRHRQPDRDRRLRRPGRRVENFEGAEDDRDSPGTGQPFGRHPRSRRPLRQPARAEGRAECAGHGRAARRKLPGKGENAPSRPAGVGAGACPGPTPWQSLPMSSSGETEPSQLRYRCPRANHARPHGRVALRPCRRRRLCDRRLPRESLLWRTCHGLNQPAKTGRWRSEMFLILSHAPCLDAPAVFNRFSALK